MKKSEKIEDKKGHIARVPFVSQSRRIKDCQESNVMIVGDFNNYRRGFDDSYKPYYAIKLSSKNFGFEDNKKIVPLYAAFCI